MHCIGNQRLASAEYAAQNLYGKKKSIAKQIQSTNMLSTPMTLFTCNRHRLKTSNIKYEKSKLRNPVPIVAELAEQLFRNSPNDSSCN
jgi:hypothetical protein